ncbi:MAG: leucine-rich repeat domain-containing protein [Clostridiales bacterium]|nr:leucine-rich repeat domain-containing protein [Clostridiales bacterium]
MRKHGRRALSLALTASIVASTAFMGVDVSAAEKNDDVVQQTVVDSLPEEDVNQSATENTAGEEAVGIITDAELKQASSLKKDEIESVEQSDADDSMEVTGTEEEITSYLIAEDTDPVSKVIDNGVLLQALIEKVAPGMEPDKFTYDVLRQYTGELDLGQVNFSSIPKDAFAKCNFTSITLPDTITSIGENAFDACQQLEHVNSFQNNMVVEDTLPSNLEAVEQRAFQQCTKLTAIAIPNLKNGRALEHAVAMFYGCTSLCNVTFGDNIEIIPSDAFESCGTAEGCEGMKIQFGTGLITIMQKAFIGTKQTGVIDLSKCTKLNDIQEKAFMGVDNLAKVKLPANTESMKIGNEAFAYPTKDYSTYLSAMGAGDSLEEGKIIIPEYVTEIGAGCFYGNTAITSIKIPAHVPYIGEYTFDGCKKLEDITFSSNDIAVTYIGDCAFRDTLTDAAFLQYMTKLKTIGTQHISEDAVKEQNDKGSSKITSLALGGQNSVVDDDGQKKNNSNEKKLCGSEVFTNCVNIKEIIIPSSVEEIGSRAFYFSNSSKVTGSTSNIQKIIWNTDGNPSASRIIYTEAFRGNQNLTEMILPADNQTLEIQAYAFLNNEKLTKLTADGANVLPQSLQSIGWGAFYNCKSLNTIEIQNKADGTSPALGKKAFEECRSLSSVQLPSSLEEIPLRCFANCNLSEMPSNLTNLTTIGELAFYGNAFVSLDLSPLVNLTRINGSAFAYLDLLADSDRDDRQYNKRIIRTLNDSRLPVLTTVILPDKAAFLGDSLFLQSGMFAGQANMTTMKTPSAGQNGQVYIPDYMIQSGYGIFAYTGVSEVIWQADTTGINRWTTIPLQMYQGCWNITQAETVLPQGSYVENIGLGLFNSSSVVSADLSGYTSLKVLGSGKINGSEGPACGVFGACTKLTSVTLPENASFTIGDFSFAADTETDFNYISVGGATKIGKKAFLNQTILKDVTFLGENHIEEIGIEAFSGCKSLVLTDSKLLEEPKVIGDKSFYDCDALGIITIGNNLTSIGNNSFAMKAWTEGKGVTKVDFSKAVNLEKIGNNAFEKTPLTEVKISGTKVSAISSNTFFDCQNLNTVIFGKEVEYIGDNALAGCCNLRRVEVEPTTTVSQGVFKQAGTNKDNKYTAQKSNNLSIVIGEPSAVHVSLGRSMDLPFYTTVNKEKSASSYAYVLLEGSEAEQDALKVSGCLSDGCYRTSIDISNKIENIALYEPLQKPYTIKVKRAGTDRSDIETIKLEGLKATKEPISLTLKGSLSFETADKAYRVNVADYSVKYKVSVSDKPICPVLYLDSAKTTAVPDGEGVMVPMNVSGSKSLTLYYKLEDLTGSGETLDVNNVVVETSDASVLYPGSGKAPEDNKFLAKCNSGSGQFSLTAASVGTATITVYPEGYPQYKHVYTYKVDSFIQTMKLSIPTEFNKANAVGTEFNIFDSCSNYFNQTVNKENIDKLSEYSGFASEIRYTSAAPDYVSVDNKGNVKILKADAKEKSVPIKVEYPRSISSNGYNMGNANVYI